MSKLERWLLAKDVPMRKDPLAWILGGITVVLFLDVLQALVRGAW